MVAWNSRGGEKLTDCGHVLKVETADLPVGWIEFCEKDQEPRMILKFFVLSNSKDGVANG